MPKKYASFQGEALFAKLDTATNNPKGFKKFGNAPKFDLALTIEEVENYESTSGQRLLDAVLYKTKNGSIDAEFMEITRENLALFLNGTVVTKTSGSVASGSGEAQATGLIVGDFIYTKHPNISAVTVKDSAGTPATLVNNTDYKVTDAAQGEIQILNVTGLTQPLKVEYSYAAYKEVVMFSAPGEEIAIRLKLKNTAMSDKRVGVAFHRAQVTPISGLALINDEFIKMPCKIKLLADETKAADPELGQFGRFIYVDDLDA